MLRITCRILRSKNLSEKEKINVDSRVRSLLRIRFVLELLDHSDWEILEVPVAPVEQSEMRKMGIILREKIENKKKTYFGFKIIISLTGRRSRV